MSAARAGEALYRIRDLVSEDLETVVRIDALQTGERKEAYWTDLLARFVHPPQGRIAVALGATEDKHLVGFLCGEVRAFEFGSEPCGWILTVAVHPACLRQGVASALVAEACRLFRGAGVGRVRTMVRRNDLPLLSFFRAGGFEGGAFVQLELDIDREHA